MTVCGFLVVFNVVLAAGVDGGRMVLDDVVVVVVVVNGRTFSRVGELLA